jgi:hypothetical protein
VGGAGLERGLGGGGRHGGHTEVVCALGFGVWNGGFGNWGSGEEGEGGVGFKWGLRLTDEAFEI